MSLIEDCAGLAGAEPVRLEVLERVGAGDLPREGVLQRGTASSPRLRGDLGGFGRLLFWRGNAWRPFKHGRGRTSAWDSMPWS